MDYQTLIKLCQKYNIEYRNHYGKSKSYIKLKRKIEQYQHEQNKKSKTDDVKCKHYYIGESDYMRLNFNVTDERPTSYYRLDNDEFSSPIKYYSFINKNSKLKLTY